MAKGNRIVQKIERAFVAFQKRDIQHVSFSQLKDWLNTNTKDGMSAPKLGAYLKRSPQFVKVQTLRRVGSNATESFWSLGAFSEGECDKLRENGWHVVKKSN
jgi:hypothetical protein